MTSVKVKICGLTREADMLAVAKAGVSYAGLVFFAKSPRNLGLAQARDLALAAPPGLAKVALTVDADDDMLDAILHEVPLDMLQLHGRETPQRVSALKARYGLPVMKALGIADAEDLHKIDLYAGAADQLLIDAKPPNGSALPGGNGLAFDWRLLQARKYWALPWMLAGGLSAQNVAQAVQLTGARQVDLSSGVESTPGLKDADQIAAFMQAVQGL